MAAAEASLPRLLGIENAPAKAAVWGRDFGAFVRRNAGRAASRPPSLPQALQDSGEGFITECRERLRKARRLQRVAAQHRHQEAHYSEHLDYLRDQEDHLRRERPEAYARFTEKEAQQKAFMANCRLSQRSQAASAAEEARLTRLRVLFAGNSEHPVLDF